jgi:hypothetical protein
VNSARQELSAIAAGSAALFGNRVRNHAGKVLGFIERIRNNAKAKSRSMGAALVRSDNSL